MVMELEEVSATHCIPMVPRMGNAPELISQAAQRFCEGEVGLSYIPPGTPWNNGYIESFNNACERSASTATTGPTCAKPVVGCLGVPV
jgi:hypothetical protein